MLDPVVGRHRCIGNGTATVVVHEVPWNQVNSTSSLLNQSKLKKNIFLAPRRRSSGAEGVRLLARSCSAHLRVDFALGGGGAGGAQHGTALGLRRRHGGGAIRVYRHARLHQEQEGGRAKWRHQVQVSQHYK